MPLSRRSLLRALGLSGAVTMTARTAEASRTIALEMSGCVSWCNRQRGFLKFRPCRSDAAERLIKLDLRHGDIEVLKQYAQPLYPLVLRLAWRPDIDILAPWQAVDIMFPNGQSVAAVTGISNIS
jgi:hypothetical protein